MAIIIGSTNQTEFSECRPLLNVGDELNSLSESFASLWGKNKFTDVTIACGNLNFPVHKAILAGIEFFLNPFF